MIIPTIGGADAAREGGHQRGQNRRSVVTQRPEHGTQRIERLDGHLAVAVSESWDQRIKGRHRGGLVE
jgi:hypothetical protein